MDSSKQPPPYSATSSDIDAKKRESVAMVASTVELWLDTLQGRIPAQFQPLFRDFRERFGTLLIEHERRYAHGNITVYLEKRTKVRALYWAIGGGIVGMLVFRALFRKAAALVTNVVGLMYPAYASMKALESKETRDDRQWLTYWPVFASFNVAEHFSDVILSWVPFYYVGKIVFLVWCFLPQTRGAEKIYSLILRPLFLKHHKKLEDNVERAAQSVVENVQRYGSELAGSDESSSQ